MSDRLRKSGFVLELPEPSPEYKALQERRSKYDIEGDLINDEKYDYETLTSDPVQYKKIGKKSKFRNVYKESPIMKRFNKDLEERQKNNPFRRKTGGKAFGPPPEKGPQPQGMNEGDFVGCPHRENGVKSDIKGISDIQVKGKKFIGVK
jgi:hypothetical protein|tara:strand:+ start:808 stop:1254 length:447 start_codon:yes stop_codon:yes gene_type:complete